MKISFSALGTCFISGFLLQVEYLLEMDFYFYIDTVVQQRLCNNQINARALIGQSAVGYCAGKPTEKS